jgi:VWFA-related protein
MIRLLVPLVLIALSSTPGSTSAKASVDRRPQTPGVRGAGRIFIDAVAADKAGAPVMDLKPDEVEVWIGHFRVPIESLTVVTPSADPSAGRLTVLVLDDVTLALEQLGRAKEVARRFVNRMQPADQMAIVNLDGSAMETTNDPTRLLRTIDAYTPQSTGLIPMDRLGEHVLKTLGTLSRQMVEAGDQRKTIVAIGSGWVFDRPIPPPVAGRDPRKEWIAAMQAMALSNVSLYVIDPNGIGGARQVDGGVNGFARETGGFAFIATNDLIGAADKIMREAANYYLIGVADPPVGRGADLREVDVRVLRKGVTVRARKTITGGS